jgi:methyltransferase (TIGR00027 family)
MLTDRPSRTAQRVAMSRAAHQVLDTPVVLDDPIALSIVGADAARDIRSHPRWLAARRARHLRAFVVARSRAAEDELAAALRRGVRQYVILGAGLDTFAYRSPYPAAALRIFEVDHPATQAWKRGRLVAAAIGVPPFLTFVPIDLETQTLAARLAEAGLRSDQPAFFSWLGVTMYLTPASVMSTLRYVATTAAPGSGLVFDYAVPPSAVSGARRLLYRALMHRVAAVGEPWRAFFAPQVLTAELAALGFRHIEDFGAADLNARFFRNRSDRLRVAGPARVMSART